MPKKVRSRKSVRTPRRESQKRTSPRPKIGAPRPKLDVRNKDPKFVYHLPLEDGIEDLRAGGYELCIDPDIEVGDNDKCSLTSAITRPAGAGKLHYLMKKRKDWYEEDIAIQQAELVNSEQSLNKPTNKGLYVGKTNSMQRGWGDE